MLSPVQHHRHGFLQRLASLFAIVVTVSSLASVQAVRAEWTGGVEGGTVVRDAGNTTRLRLVLRNDERPLSHYLFAEWLRAGSESNSYSLGYNPRYWFTSNYYSFAESQFRTDEPLGIEQELKLIAGIGGQFIRAENQGLYAEAGVGGRSIEFDGIEDASNEALGVARLGYFRTLVDTLKLDLILSAARSSEEVSEASSEVGVSLRVPNGAVRVAYRTRYLKVGDTDSITDDDSFVSFDYSF